MGDAPTPAVRTTEETCMTHRKLSRPGVVALALLLAVAACGKGKSPNSGGGTPTGTKAPSQVNVYGVDGNTNNALTQGQQAESVVEYSDGNVKAAELVGKKLGITQVEKIDPQTQGLAGDATVTVIVGADKAGGTGSSG